MSTKADAIRIRVGLGLEVEHQGGGDEEARARDRLGVDGAVGARVDGPLRRVEVLCPG